MSSIRIRAATERDVPVILELIRGLADYEKLAHEVSATEEQLSNTLFGAKPGAEVLLAEDEQEIAGFALFFRNYSTFLAKPGIYLEDLYVKPHHRGKGIGFGLLVNLARLAVERGCGRMEWSVLDWNEPSIQFYKKLGAVPKQEWHIYRLTGDALEKLAATGPQPEIAVTSSVPPAISGVLESSLYVDDVQASAQFYERIFGFKIISRFGPRGCAMEAGPRQVLLLFKKGASRAITSPHDGDGELHLAFAISADALSDWETWLAQNGITVEERTTWERGGVSLYFRDPDRHLLEVATPGVWSIY